MLHCCTVYIAEKYEKLGKFLRKLGKHFKLDKIKEKQAGRTKSKPKTNLNPAKMLFSDCLYETWSYPPLNYVKNTYLQLIYHIVAASTTTKATTTQTTAQEQQKDEDAEGWKTVLQVKQHHNCTLAEAEELVKDCPSMAHPNKPNDDRFKLYKVFLEKKETNSQTKSKVTKSTFKGNVDPEGMQPDTLRNFLATLAPSERAAAAKAAGLGNEAGGGRRDRSRSRTGAVGSPQMNDKEQRVHAWATNLGQDSRSCIVAQRQLSEMGKKQAVPETLPPLLPIALTRMTRRL